VQKLGEKTYNILFFGLPTNVTPNFNNRKTPNSIFKKQILENILLMND
jgi:hypothetical protein